MDSILQAHDKAVRNGLKSFIFSGKTVMTSLNHIQRGSCCGNKCLFCPYKHSNVKNHVCDCEYQFLDF